MIVATSGAMGSSSRAARVCVPMVNVTVPERRKTLRRDGRAGAEAGPASGAEDGYLRHAFLLLYVLVLISAGGQGA